MNIEIQLSTKVIPSHHWHVSKIHIPLPLPIPALEGEISLVRHHFCSIIIWARGPIMCCNVRLSQITSDAENKIPLNTLANLRNGVNKPSWLSALQKSNLKCGQFVNRAVRDQLLCSVPAPDILTTCFYNLHYLWLFAVVLEQMLPISWTCQHKWIGTAPAQ